MNSVRHTAPGEHSKLRCERISPYRLPAFILLLALLLLCGGAFAEADDPAGWAPIISVRADAKGALYVAAGEAGGLYSSANGGRSWRHIGSAISSDNFYSLRVSPQGHLFLCTFNEVLFSKNGGVSWNSMKGGGFYKDFFRTKTDSFVGVHLRDGLRFIPAKDTEEGARSAGGVDSLVTDILEGGDGRLWSATFGGGVLVSTNGGKNWSTFGDGPVNRFTLSLAWSGSTATLFAGTLEGGVFLRRGEGAWESASEGLPPNSTVQALAVAKDGTVWAGTHRDGCFVSRYGGRAWEPFPAAGGKGVAVTAIEPFRDGVVVGTASGGLFYAEASRSSWTLLLPSTPVTGLVERERGRVLALSRSGRLFHSADGGRTWRDEGRDVGGGGKCAVLLKTSDEALLAGGAGCIHRSEDGKNWTEYNFPAKKIDDSVFSPREAAPALDPVIGMAEAKGSIFAATWRNGLLRSRDGGRNWEQVEGSDEVSETPSLFSDFTEYRYIYSLSSDGGERIALATDQGFSVSIDGGETWKSSYVNSGLFAVLFDHEGKLWGAGRNGLWMCSPEDMAVEEITMDGFEWSPFNYFTGLYQGANGTVFGVLKDALHRLLPEGGGRVLEAASLANTDVLSLLVLSDGGVLLSAPKAFYRSDDGGKTWKEIELP